MNSRYFKIMVASLAIIAFSAFGCKNADTVATDDVATTQPTQEVTFAPPEPTGITTGDTTTDTKAPTQQVDFPTNGTDTTTSPTADDTTVDLNVTNVAPDVQPAVEEISEEDTVIKLARTLAEIFGTFTNKDKELYGNYKSLLPYATDKVSTWLNGEITKGSTADLSTPFYGITTRAISAGVLEASATAYKILVTTEREAISEESNTPSKQYQLIEIDLIKVGDDWKLNGTYWQ